MGGRNHSKQKQNYRRDSSLPSTILGVLFEFWWISLGGSVPFFLLFSLYSFQKINCSIFTTMVYREMPSPEWQLKLALSIITPKDGSLLKAQVTSARKGVAFVATVILVHLSGDKKMIEHSVYAFASGSLYDSGFIYLCVVYSNLKMQLFYG